MPVMPTRLLRLYATETLATIGANLLVAGIFFYTKAHFGWGPRQNLLLASGQGVMYVIGALAADRVAKLTGRRGLLMGLSLGLALLPLIAVWRPTSPIVAGVVLAYTLLHAAQWPALESLVSSGAAAGQLSRRISVYNLVWSGGGAMTIASIGTILDRFPSRAFFCIPVAVHTLAICLLFKLNSEAATTSAEHATPEPELLVVRILAMRLSRIALPATMAVIYSLGGAHAHAPGHPQLSAGTSDASGQRLDDHALLHVHTAGAPPSGGIPGRDCCWAQRSFSRWDSSALH